VEGRAGGHLAHRAIQSPVATAVALALIAALAYANSLLNGFTLDDAAIILSNPLVHSLTGVWRAFAHPYWPEAWGWGQYRPLAIASFTVQWWLGGGAPWVFHLVCIAWHATACVLVWRLLSAWLAPAGAAFGALWFALHPVHVEAVASVVGQTELMAAVFVLAACLAHRRGQRIAALWFALALLSKESGIVFLGLAVAIDLMDGKRRFALYVRYGVVAALYAACLVILFESQPLSKIAPTWAGATLGERWLTMLTVVPQYVQLLVAPTTLHMDYGPRVIELATAVTLPVVVGAALLVLTVLVAVAARKRAPAITLALAWVAIAIAPVANVLFPSGVVMAERTLYLPSVGAALIAGWAAYWLLERAPRPAAALATACAVAFAARTWTRTPVWHDDIALTLAALHDSPTSYKAHHAAGVLFAQTGHWTEAANEYRYARWLFPLDVEPYRGGAEAALVVHDYDGAAALLDSARRLVPRRFSPWIRLADVRFKQERWREASALAFGAYEMSPDSLRALGIAINANVRAGDIREAASIVKRGLADHPGDERLRRESVYVAGLPGKP
jgi:tetratricopeptide (TPR) repeat protein